METVLFARVHDARRSQISAALFNLSADPAKARGSSAGTEPGPRVLDWPTSALGSRSSPPSSAAPADFTRSLQARAQRFASSRTGTIVKAAAERMSQSARLSG